ncbi:MAG: excinuclease ABC subunit UvrA [Proteobacteria bacterium]|nr:excinuclease ABC subunit UvrA [Pseudomonadota bacterium]MBU1711196.1 excinuclease ABC subunit UvrA [Pseudomonadota bacterium]
MEPKYIRIRGARMHNLKNIDVDLPRNKLVVFTGLSGSGKSTLAFDTLYAEGQRRYVESLSTYARQFLGQMEKPDVDSLEGLSPAVSIEQRTTGRNPRSTVGTITEIYDHLRLLFARVGHPFCPECGQEIRPQSIQDMVSGLLGLDEGTKILLLSPLVEGKKGEHRELLNGLRRDGYVRVRVDGETRNLDEEITLEKNKRHSIEVVVDRLVIKPGVTRRLADSVSTAVRLSEGFLLVVFPQNGKETLFSERSACVQCGRSLPDLTPQLFSFNSPKGACEECGGLGVKQFFNPHLVVPDPELSITQGAIAPWRYRSSSNYSSQLLAALAKHYGFDIQRPFRDIPQEAQDAILYGTGKEEVHFLYQSHKRRLTYQAPFEGILPQLNRRFHETKSPAIRDELSFYMSEQECPACKGARLKPEALAVKVGGKNINDLTHLSISSLGQELKAVHFEVQEAIIAERILKEISDRLCFLIDVGLGYLSIDRRASTLSGGEAQRIRLASQIGSRLAGVLYILDEPSIGLHQRDNDRLIRTLTNLRDLGNTVIVVEHDVETILAADYVVDIGPGAGVHGGNIVYAGSVKKLLKNKESITGGYLSGRLSINIPEHRRQIRKKKAWITIHQARINNLKDITVKFPLGVMTCVTGVSGSGKSSLVIETLFKGAKNAIMKIREPAGDCQGFDGLEEIDKVIDINQSPIGRTPRSNPATYTGILTPVRELFSRLPEARARGYKPGRFSFNLKGGRCEACEGEGVIKIAMHFLPDIYITCETCMGKRYNHETLEIKYRGKNISEVLAMTVEEALGFFKNVPPVNNRLQTIFDVGLSYVSLGQSSVTLSGGEAQRIKLAKELGKRSTGRTLYILDEPTTGLHPHDIKHLLRVLGQLVDGGNTVIIIEHNLDVIKTADYIIDLGPEGGDEGGAIVATGTPEVVAAQESSYTGKYLKRVLQ